MGRDRKNELREGHFTKLVRHTMETDAWRALSPVAQALYPWLKLEWNGPKYNNNGQIRLSVRQAADRVGVTRNTAAGALHQLQAKGFIAVTRPAQLGLSGVATCPDFELTELPMPTSQSTKGRHLYKQWKEGGDFPVSKGPVHNPSGRRSKGKARHQNADGTVIDFETRRT